MRLIFVNIMLGFCLIYVNNTFYGKNFTTFITCLFIFIILFQLISTV